MFRLVLLTNDNLIFHNLVPKPTQTKIKTQEIKLSSLILSRIRVYESDIKQNRKTQLFHYRF